MGDNWGGIGAKMKHDKLIYYGENGQPCFPLPQPSQCNEGYFFQLPVKNATSKEEMVCKGELTCTLSILGRCFS